MRNVLIFTGILLIYAGKLYGQEEHVPTFEDTMAVYEGLFYHQEPLHLTIKTDLRTFRRQRHKNKYHRAEMTCKVSESFQVTHPVRIKARGIHRRETCTYPPFWLNIRKSGIEADSLTDLGIKRIKMVISCETSSQYELYVLREYLVYKIYNLISPFSFRVRLVRLIFVDTGKDNKTQEGWAFLIEPEDLLAHRVEGVMVNSDRLSIRTVNGETMDVLALFQYMIGNGDFSVNGRHNIKIVTLKDQRVPGYLPIPYDFDYSGLVNTRYSVPEETLGISSVRERYFLGPCRDREIQQKAIDEFMVYRDEMIEYIMNFEYLPEDEREEMVAYLATYFQEASDERFIRRKIATTCR